MQTRWALGILWAIATAAAAGEGGGTANLPDPNALLGKEASVETIFTNPVAKADAVPRLALPDPAGQKTAQAELRKEFKDELASRKPAQRRELVAKFLELAQQTKGDANRLWAQLEEAINLALELKDYQTVLVLCDYRAARFEGLEAMAQRKEVFGKAKTSPVIAAVITLLEQPADPNANLVVGKHFCFDQGNWEVGLPLLACGADAGLKQVVELELAKPDDHVQQRALGDLWYDLGKKTTKPLKERMLARCLFWYDQVKVGLTGVVKEQVAKRIEEISDLLPPSPNLDWGNLTARQWDRLKGQEFTLPATKNQVDTGIRLSPGQKLRVVPHPTDTWTMNCYNDYYTTNAKGTKQKTYNNAGALGGGGGLGGGAAGTGGASGVDIGGVDSGDPDFQLGELVAYVGKEKARHHAGVITGEGELYLGPNQNRGLGTKGSMRVKLLPVEDE